MRTCGLALSRGSLIPPVRLPPSVSRKQWPVSLRASSASSATASEPLRSSATSVAIGVFLIYSQKRERKTITLGKRWTRGNNLVADLWWFSRTSSTSHPQIRRLSARVSYVTDDAEAIYSSMRVLHVGAGCHQDHRQSHIIIRSLYCRLRGSSALFRYHCC